MVQFGLQRLYLYLVCYVMHSLHYVFTYHSSYMYEKQVNKALELQQQKKKTRYRAVMIRDCTGTGMHGET